MRCVRETVETALASSISSSESFERNRRTGFTRLFCVCLTAGGLAFTGCGRSSDSRTGRETSDTGHARHEGADHDIDTSLEKSPSADAREFHPILLVGGQSDESPSGQRTGTPAPDDQPFETAMQALGTCQLLIGRWRGTTEKVIGGFGNVESAQWEWDLQSGGLEPALLMIVTSSPSYFRSGRLTYLPDQQTFQFDTIDRSGVERIYQGSFLATTRNHREHALWQQSARRTVKLDLLQVSPATDGKQARIVINLQNPDRYLLEVYEIRGGRVDRYDTVVASRQGLRHAHAESNGSRRQCLITGGAATIPVEHAGETYWVCCEGCKSAVEKDPERWISRHNRQHGRH